MFTWPNKLSVGELHNCLYVTVRTGLSGGLWAAVARQSNRIVETMYKSLVHNFSRWH